MAYTKKTNTTETVKNESVKEEKKVLENKSKATSIVKEYNGDDLIPCRSMTKGELICVGKKSKETYMWADYGDITEVEYQDLLALKASKSSFIFDTLFIIDDEELLEGDKWKEVKALYEGIYSKDVPELIAMNSEDFKRVFPTLPSGLKKAVMTEVATQMEAGTFDSIQKIKLIDEICDTDLSSLL